MGDMYDKLGDLLSRKISEEECEDGTECIDHKDVYGDATDCTGQGTVGGEKISDCMGQGTVGEDGKVTRVRLKDVLPQKEVPVGVVVHADDFTEDTPVKIINAEVTFSKDEEQN